MMIHHVREIQLRLLTIVGVLILGMIVGYVYYEPLFEFIKAPLNGPLHYTSPAGSFTFIIKICMVVGIIAALPVAVYNGIMFVQPALIKRLSKMRVYLTTFASLLLAGLGAAFGFLVIIPLALRFFYKFQVDGLVALISADEYLRFVVGVIITFVLIFQLPLLISLIDHIKPLPPKKLFKLEKFIIVGSVFIGVVVPFALDPTVQLLIASPIIVLYNISILIVMLQHAYRKRRAKKIAPLPSVSKEPVRSGEDAAPEPIPLRTSVLLEKPEPAPIPQRPRSQPRRRSMDGMRPVAAPHKATDAVRQSVPRGTIITDIRPTSRMHQPARSASAVPRQQMAE